jgi:hypothetical protein
LVVPSNISPIPLPPYAPELNPVERIWLHLRERLLSHYLLDGSDAVLEARCEAWTALTPECIRSLTAFPRTEKGTSEAQRYEETCARIAGSILCGAHGAEAATACCGFPNPRTDLVGSENTKARVGDHHRGGAQLIRTAYYRSYAEIIYYRFF